DSPFICKVMDNNVYDASRIMRAIGSINDKYDHEPVVTVKCYDRIINGMFLNMLKVNPSSAKKKGQGLSTMRASEMVEVELKEQGSMKCPSPHHDEENASFRYYPQTDTFYCFGCKKGGDGASFLKFMGREDLLADLKAESDMTEMPGWILKDDGKMHLRGTKGKTELVCDFGSAFKVEAVHPNGDRRVYIDHGEMAILVSTYPSVKSLRQEYTARGLSFHTIAPDNKTHEAITNFLEQARVSDNMVIESRGRNEN
ncbi:unnamed protein product, partial [marine sediment metagenome]